MFVDFPQFLPPLLTQSDRWDYFEYNNHSVYQEKCSQSLKVSVKLEKFCNHDLNFPISGLTKDDLKKFVEDNFEEAEELENWIPPDFTDRPALASLVADWKYKKWILLLNQIWKQLGKKMNIDVLVNADRHSLIYVSISITER